MSDPEQASVNTKSKQSRKSEHSEQDANEKSSTLNQRAGSNSETSKSKPKSETKSKNESGIEKGDDGGDGSTKKTTKKDGEKTHSNTQSKEEQKLEKSHSKTKSQHTNQSQEKSGEKQKSVEKEPTKSKESSLKKSDGSKVENAGGGGGDKQNQEALQRRNSDDAEKILSNLPEFHPLRLMFEKARLEMLNRQVTWKLSEMKQEHLAHLETVSMLRRKKHTITKADMVDKEVLAILGDVVTTSQTANMSGTSGPTEGDVISPNMASAQVFRVNIEDKAITATDETLYLLGKKRVGDKKACRHTSGTGRVDANWEELQSCVLPSFYVF